MIGGGLWRGTEAIFESEKEVIWGYEWKESWRAKPTLEKGVESTSRQCNVEDLRWEAQTGIANLKAPWNFRPAMIICEDGRKEN